MDGRLQLTSREFRIHVEPANKQWTVLWCSQSAALGKQATESVDPVKKEEFACFAFRIIWLDGMGLQSQNQTSCHALWWVYNLRTRPLVICRDPDLWFHIHWNVWGFYCRLPPQLHSAARTSALWQLATWKAPSVQSRQPPSISWLPLKTEGHSL